MKRFTYFYGYNIVTAGFGIQAIGVGIFVAFGIFFKPLLIDFEWSRAVLSGAQSLALLIAGILAILIGRLSDRLDPRIVMSIAAFFFGLGLMLMSGLNHVWQLFLFYGVIFGIGLSAIDIIALSTTARWFVRRRGIMTGIVKVGTGAGQLVIPLVASLLIAGYGWRASYVIIGAAAMVLLVFIGQLLRRDPAQMGLLPDGIKRLRTQSSKLAETAFYMREALRTRQLWTIWFTFLTTMFCLLTIMVHIVPHVTDIGISSTTAAGILSAIGGISMVGRFVTGVAIDRIGSRLSMIICLILLILALLWLQLAGELWMFYLFAVVYGFAHGGLYTVVSPIVAEYFGIRSHGALFGIVNFSTMAGGAVGPIIAGHIFDTAGSYSLAFWICTGVSALALVLILTLRKTRLNTKEKPDIPMFV
ncbi:MFS transporter [Chloroflexota bacterium]